MKNECLTRLSLGFLLIQQHVGDSAGDGEHTSRLWALQGALHHLHLRGSGEELSTGSLRVMAVQPGSK